MNPPSAVSAIVRLALEEDIGAGDITTRYFCRADAEMTARIVSREKAVFAGSEAALETFRQVDPALKMVGCALDGAVMSPGDVAMEVHGNAASILQGERVSLNFIQRLSGIATQTATYVEAVRGTRARILDTRKTTPGLRYLEKAAVRAGGGVNHRMGLHDMALVKDNHLLASGGLDFLQQAIDRLKAEHPAARVEFEADRLDQVRGFITLRGVDRILLDNMSLAELRAAVELNAGKVELEASGGVTLHTIREIAETGVDFISVGALTHSVRAIDFSLEFHP